MPAKPAARQAEEDAPRPGSYLYNVVKSRGGKAKYGLSFQDLDAEVLKQALIGVSQEGGSIQLGLTRKGAAFSLRVWTPDGTLQEYPESVAELEAWLGSLYFQQADQPDSDPAFVAMQEKMKRKAQRDVAGGE